jgi:hypothetical protein
MAARWKLIKCTAMAPYRQSGGQWLLHYDQILKVMASTAGGGH